MQQPQDLTMQNIICSAHERLTQEISEQDRLFPDEAKFKAERFEEVKEEICTILLDVDGKLQSVKQKIKSNLRNNQNQDGLFTGDELEYIKCVDLKKDNL